MKHITFTPKGFISILLSISLLCNITVPAFAQSHIPPSSQIQQDLVRQVSSIAQDTVIPGFNKEASFQKIHDFVRTEMKGSLTEEQVNRIQQIEDMFSPADVTTPGQSDFESFEKTYLEQIDSEFKRETQAQADSKREIQQKIDSGKQNFENEIYTSIIPKTAERLLAEKSVPTDTAEELLTAIKNIHAPLGNQLTDLADSYAQTPQADLVSEVLQAVQQSANERAAAITAWKDKAETQLKEWYDPNIAALEKWQKEAKQRAKEVFEKEYLPQILKERENIVRQSVDTLWAYKDLGLLAQDTLLKVAPIIAPMSTLDGKSFFTVKQKDWLISQYRDTLRSNHQCGEKFPKDLPCDMALRAISGLGMLTDSRDAAEEIREFMDAKLKSEQAVPVLLLGTVSLLSMKQYTVLRGFLHNATQAENSMDNMDWLSFETLVNTQANRNGHYLGEVSKYGQYPLYTNDQEELRKAQNSKERAVIRESLEEKALGNVWEDIAQILADEGSPESLALLREFGIEKCVVYDYMKVSFESEKRLTCGGIIPFLAGALISGKSGAEQYNPWLPNTQSGYVATAHGNEYITPKQAQTNRALAQQRVTDFHQFATEKGLTNAGLVIRHLFLQSMGDLNAETELRLDTLLYEAFQTQNQTPKEGANLTPYTRNSATYNAKRLRQDRTQTFRMVGRLADVALLVWCLVDLTKWSISGVKIAKALSQMSRMARSGATVAQRAAYLHRLKIAPKVIKFAKIPTKIRSGAAPAILTSLPQFSNQTVELPMLPGALKSTGLVTAENLAFSAQTGKLLVNYQGLLAGGLTPERAETITNAVDGAVQAANTAFANSRRWSLSPNRSYNRLLRSKLDESLRAIHLVSSDRYAILGQVSAMQFKVPSNINTFKAPDLFKVLHGQHIPGIAPAVNISAVEGLMTTSLGYAPSPAQLKNTTQLMGSALHHTNVQFANLPWWQRSNGRYKKLYLNNLIAVFDHDGLVFKNVSYNNFFKVLMEAVGKDRSLVAPSEISSWRKLAQGNSSTHFVPLGKALFVPETGLMQELPLSIQAEPNVKNLRKGLYQRVTFTYQKPKNKSPFLELGLDGEGLPLTKIKLNTEEVPVLLQSAAQADLPLRLKVTASQPVTLSSLWENIRLTHKVDGKRYFFRGRGELFTHEIPLRVRQADGSLQGTKIFLHADSHLGWRNTIAVLDGKNLSLHRGGNLLQPSGLTFSLPKNQLHPFLQVLRNTPVEKPFTLTLARGKNKIKPLMWANGLSLSSASSGLIVPLENTYGDQITETDKIMITLALPYIPALLSPVISPFVMRYGALNVLKASMVFSLAGLGFAGVAGFRGYASQQSPLPPIWPLFVSGTAIGISASLSRASLNILINGMGGGGHLLKSMLAKNVGSMALLLPPFVANFIDKDIDFSLAFPVMSVLSLSMLGWISATRIDTSIGREAGFLLRNRGLINEGRSAVRLLVTPEVGTLVLATTAFTGFEAAAFAKAGNQMLGPKVKDANFISAIPESNRKNANALFTAILIQSLPLIARAGAVPLTKALKSPLRAGEEYRRILKMSYALNIAGGSLLFANGLQSDNKILGFIGLGMMGLGTANVTQSLQKLSNLRALDSRYVLRKTAGLAESARNIMKDSMVTKAMTGFSSSQIGLAAVPYMVGRYTDRQIAEGIEIKSQAGHDSLWIPLIFIGLSAGLAGPTIGILPKHIPQGLPFVTKGLVGSYPAAFKQLTSPGFGMKDPRYGVPPGFLPIPVNPIVNMEKLLPSKRVMENAERQLKQQTQGY